MIQRRIVVGDVHGCFFTLKKLLLEVVQIGESDKIYFLGDLIDRGPRVKQTLDFVIDLWEKGKAVAIRGNHEDMLLQSISDPIALVNWEYNGCQTTLYGFNVKHPKDIPVNYIHFFESMPFYVELEKYVLVHGDLDFNSPDPFENKYYMVWGRSRKVVPEKIGMRKLIVGHTPTPLDEIMSSINGWKIYLDGGCVYAYNPFKSNLGYLCAFDIDSETLFYVFNQDYNQ
ncbi:MAG: serine/threonine protein phosphatase [Ignavibacteria bacterium]|nr:serine/threonine protein phosphatase [Ignavibacteria bacterium]